MLRESVVSIVPIKHLSQAKGRLAGILKPEEREALSLAMLSDVLATLGQVLPETDTVVVTGDDRVAACALDAGVGVIEEPEGGGLNEALAHAARILGAERASGLLVLPGDIPLASAVSVNLMVSTKADVALVADRARVGTNALFMRPVTAIPFCFGGDSLRRHQSEARARGLIVTEPDLADLALDIDDADDLRAFALTSGSCRTRTWLRESGVERRCGLEIRSGIRL